MKYSESQLRAMLTVHFTKVAEATQWDRIDVRELDCFVNDCRFAVVEKYLRGERFPSVDVLFLPSGEVKNYQAFIVENGTLKEFHQEHREEFCLTCGEREAEVPAGAF